MTKDNIALVKLYLKKIITYNDWAIVSLMSMVVWSKYISDIIALSVMVVLSILGFIFLLLKSSNYKIQIDKLLIDEYKEQGEKQ
jgi:hypothetical protein